MRRFLSIILVFCLVASLFVIPASSAAAGTVGTAGGFDVVSSILFGLGLSVDSVENFSAWNDVVTASQEYLSENGFIDSDGNISTLSSSGKTFLPLTILLTVRDWLFDSDTITYYPNSQLSDVYTFDSATYTITNNSASVFYSCTVYEYLSSGKPYYVLYPLFFSSSSFFVSGLGSSTLIEDTLYICTLASVGERSLDTLISTYPKYFKYGYVYFSDETSSESRSKVYNYCKSIILNDNSAFFDTLPGIVVTEVSPIPDTEIEINYPDWAAGSILSPPITLPGGTEEDDLIEYIPVSISPFNSSSLTIPTQAEIWTGQDNSGPPSNPDDSDDDSTLTLSDITVITFLSKLLADLTRTLFGNGTMTLTELFGSTWTEIQNLGKTISEGFTSILDGLKTGFDTLSDFLSDLLDWALGLVGALLAGFESLLVKIFVPDIPSIQAAVDDLRAQFPFFDSIIATGQYIHAGISSGSPPVIYMHLEDAEGSLAWGGTVAALDMSFYSRYKSAGDLIMSSALITVFAWHTFKRLPGIISGAGSDVEIMKEL